MRWPGFRLPVSRRRLREVVDFWLAQDRQFIERSDQLRSERDQAREERDALRTVLNVASQREAARWRERDEARARAADLAQENEVLKQAIRAHRDGRASLPRHERGDGIDHKLWAVLNGPHTIVGMRVEDHADVPDDVKLAPDEPEGGR